MLLQLEWIAGMSHLVGEIVFVRMGWRLGMAETSVPVEEVSRVEQIYVHAARLFVARGFAATSMSDLAKAVGITKAGLYHFVRSKEDVLFDLMTWAMDMLDKQVTKPAQDIVDPLDRLVFIIRNHLFNIGSHHFQNDNPLTIIVDEPAGLSPERRLQVNERKAAYFRFVRKTVKELKADGRLHDLDPTNATFAILGMVVWLARWYRDNGPNSLNMIAQDLTGFALRGVIRPEALVEAGYDQLDFSEQLLAPAPALKAIEKVLTP